MEKKHLLRIGAFILASIVASATFFIIFSHVQEQDAKADFFEDWLVQQGYDVVYEATVLHKEWDIDDLTYSFGMWWVFLDYSNESTVYRETTSFYFFYLSSTHIWSLKKFDVATYAYDIREVLGD